MRRSAPPYRSLNLGENLYLAAMPAGAEALDLPRLTSGSMSVHGAAVNTLFGKMAWPILRHRADEFAGMVGESFAVATGLHPTVRATRLFSSPWHWAALGSLLVLTVAGRARDTKIALAGALLIGMHLLHLCIVVLFDVPLPRYVHATEIFVVLALVLLIDHHVRVVACAARANWRTLSAPTAEQVHPFDLFIELGASDEQADFPVIYATGIEGRAGLTPDLGPDLSPLFDVILHRIPAPKVDLDAPLQLLVTTLGYDDYRGVTAVGRIFAGKIKAGQRLARLATDGRNLPESAKYLYTFQGLNKVEIEEALAGDIVSLAGLEGIAIGETLA